MRNDLVLLLNVISENLDFVFKKSNLRHTL